MRIGIKVKLILVMIPIQIVAIAAVAFFATLSARSGITNLAINALGFKAYELNKYSQNQWDILIKNQLSEEPAFVDAAQRAIISYSETLIQRDTEAIYSFQRDNTTNEINLTFSTEDSDLSEQDLSDITLLIDNSQEGWVEISLGNIPRVSQTFVFEPLNWYFLVTEHYNSFYADAERIAIQSAIIAIIALGISLFLSIFFIEYSTRPMKKTVAAMVNIIKTNDLSTRVEVQENDEFGQMAQTFNVMTDELNKAYDQIKNYALRSVIARRNETKIRNIFQKYVPNNVIESIFSNPERMLVGENRKISVMFSDIRSFTTISEGLLPEDLVTSLNNYFSIMVDIIIENNGIIDKYIGDAIMAIFGAPVNLDNAPLNALKSAIKMQQSLKIFNDEQESNNRPRFRTGIGIVHGEVTVGNIGSEKKMDYTVIGDTVNLGARLEALTKFYKIPILFSHSVFDTVKESFPCRMVDIVKVRGKTRGERIYTALPSLSTQESEAWKKHHQALKLYYDRDFSKARTLFRQVERILPNDSLSNLFSQRCSLNIETPPPEDWKGIESTS